MGCGCNERREIAKKVVAAVREGNHFVVRQSMSAMAKSMRDDAAKVVRRYRIKPDVAKSYGLNRKA